jgi:mRNA interferase MazF
MGNGKGNIFICLIFISEMKKDYKIWMPVKAGINNNGAYPRGYKEREIWVCNVGENIGFEEDGKGNNFIRPVLILKVFNRQFCHIVPLSKAKKSGRFYYSFDGKTGNTSMALLSQSRAIDSSRLLRKIGVADSNDFTEIKNRIKGVLSL